MSKPNFSFMANNAMPSDKSGTATWDYETQDLGEWVMKQHRHPFASFSTAAEMDRIIKAAYERGEAAGYAACEERVLAALKG